ncbi:MAG TPA: hypothetical protein VGK99_19690 [Acidobacteriota bacterium]|jgi:hypothetical protein
MSNQAFTKLAAGVLIIAGLSGISCTADKDTADTLVRRYARVALDYDTGELTEVDRAVLKRLSEAAAPINSIFWKQVFPDKDGVQQRLKSSSKPDDKKRLGYFLVNYGPYDRLYDFRNFLEGPPRPPGVAFYPADLTSLEFEEYVVKHPQLKSVLESPTTMVKRTSRGFEALSYESAFRAELEESAASLKQAAELTRGTPFSAYLESRSRALVRGRYRESDRQWVLLRDEPLDIIIGPIEVSEDQLLGIKAAYEAAVLVRDVKSTQDLNRFAGWADRYAPEAGFRRLDANRQSTEVWQVALFAGELDAGVKTVATTLPNDEEVRKELGTRKLIFSNVLRAKFQRILRPLAESLLAPQFSRDVTESSLFQQALLHESCHPFQGGGNRQALGGTITVLDELKADLLALYVASRASQDRLISMPELRQLQTSYIAGVLRALRLGPGSEYAQASALALNGLTASGALRLERGVFQLKIEKLDSFLRPLLERVREIEFRADFLAARKFLDERTGVPSGIQRKLISLTSIPVDVAFDYRLPK